MSSRLKAIVIVVCELKEEEKNLISNVSCDVNQKYIQTHIDFKITNLRRIDILNEASQS